MTQDQETIANYVCRKFGVTIGQLIDGSRAPFMSRARATFVYLLRQEGYQTSWVAHIMGKGSDSVRWCVRIIEDELEMPDTNDKLNRLIKEVIREWEKQKNDS